MALGSRGEAFQRVASALLLDRSDKPLRIGSTPYPDEVFVIQTMRHLTDPVVGILRANSVLICDRDRKWSVPV